MVNSDVLGTKQTLFKCGFIFLSSWLTVFF